MQMKKSQPHNTGEHFRILASAFCIFGLVLISLLQDTKSVFVGQLSDVTQNSYEGQAALYLQERGVISGFPDGTFRGQNAVNRVEAAKMLLLAGNFTLRQIQSNTNYRDIQAGAWYEQFALNAVDKGIMAGYPDGSFGPDKTVIRAEFLKMITNAFQIERNLAFHYNDVPTDAWYSEYAGAAEKYNLFLYDKNQLLPSAPMSRDEVAWAMYQMLVLRSYDFVIRTPFDYAFTTTPKTPDTLHAAASSSSQSSVSVASSSVVSSAASSVRIAQYCTDSDQSNTYPDGYDVNKKGTAHNLLMSAETNSFTDECRTNSNVLLEFYCNEDGYLAAAQINCPINCEDGACSAKPRDTEEEVDPRRPTGTLSSSSSSSITSSTTSSEQTFTGCSDTDTTGRFTTGKNIYTKGTTNGLQSDTSRLAITDICKDNVKLTEYYCQGEYLVSEEVLCSLGCSNGACVSPGTTGSCVDQDANSTYPDGKNFTVKSRIYVDHPEEGNVSYEDNCKESQLLEEFYCATNGRVGRYTQVCNCVDGVCVDTE